MDPSGGCTNGQIIHSELSLVCALLNLSCEFKGERKDKSKRAQMWAKESAVLSPNIWLSFGPQNKTEMSWFSNGSSRFQNVERILDYY